MPKAPITVAGAAELLGCHISSVMNWVHAKRLPAQYIGGIYLFRESDLRAFVRPTRGRPAGRKDSAPRKKTRAVRP